MMGAPMGQPMMNGPAPMMNGPMMNGQMPDGMNGPPFDRFSKEH